MTTAEEMAELIFRCHEDSQFLCGHLREAYAKVDGNDLNSRALLALLESLLETSANVRNQLARLV